MKHSTTLTTLTLTSIYACSMLPVVGCDRANQPAATATEDHGHEHADGHDHDHAAAAPAAGETKAETTAETKAETTGGHDDHGPVTQLGEQEQGGFKIKASRDGAIKAGDEAPIDVWVTGGAKVSAVRFWIGTEDAKGSIKAKAAIEHDNWHTHAEVPNPLPNGSKLWVEIEAEGGAKTVVGFELEL